VSFQEEVRITQNRKKAFFCAWSAQHMANERRSGDEKLGLLVFFHL
jgi:hypothetical protein